eukprot:Tamp_08454.p1 GENE.Tamp_08454~~Tamp_08454.p1  ORF type:complete len:675 (+),score=70.20 Tamp_08454:41-2026(+)
MQGDRGDGGGRANRPEPRAVINGRGFREFRVPDRPFSGLDVAAKHVRGQREQQQVVVKHLMGMVLFERVALSGADAYGEVIHPETAFYPHITKSRIPLDQLLADTGSSLEQGLVLGTTTRSQLTDESSRFVDQLRTVPGAATGLGAALSQKVERVIRNGRETTLLSSELQRGDILRLQPGDVVPSDVYIASILAKPFCAVRRNVPDYCDYISTDDHVQDLKVKSAAQPNKLAINGSMKSPGGSKSTNGRSSELWKLGFGGQASSETEVPEGWEGGLRTCLPVCSVGSIVTHGDVVQWGEALALVLKPAIESSWSWMWRKTLRYRARMADRQAKKREEEERTAQVASGQEKQTPQSLLTDRWLLGLEKKGLIIQHPHVTHLLEQVSCVIIEDDIRCNPVHASDHAANFEHQSSGIGIGVAHDESEFLRRYGDILALTQRCGIATIILLRKSSVSSLDVCRIARWMRFGICAPSNAENDFQTPPLSEVFKRGGAIVRVGNEVSAAADLVYEVQSCHESAMDPNYHRSVVANLRNPFGVMSHIVSSGYELPTEVPIEDDEKVKEKLRDDVRRRRERAKNKSVVQDDLDIVKHHLVCYIGEDWAALSAADVGITWNSSLSPGAYEARKLAAARLRDNSPANLLRSVSDLAMTQSAKSRGSHCTVA